MIHVDETDIDMITEAVGQILDGKAPRAIRLPEKYSGNEIGQLVHYVNKLIAEYNRFSQFMFAISRGDLDYNAPKGELIVLHSLKNLQANLRHLTWKTQQVARGDFAQRVDFMGEFSDSYNSMVEQLAAAREELLKKNEELENVSRKDPLTGLLNRRGADEIIRKESHRASRTKRSFAIMMADIDHFKKINDTHGHDAGDAVLATISKILAENVRKEDLCSRWGGEEFLLLLVETDIPDAYFLAERLRRNVENARIMHCGVALQATISAGMSMYGEDEDIAACIKRSDLCLYKAKESGRNQIWFKETCDTPPIPVPRAANQRVYQKV